MPDELPRLWRCDDCSRLHRLSDWHEVVVEEKESVIYAMGGPGQTIYRRVTMRLCDTCVTGAVARSGVRRGEG